MEIFVFELGGLLLLISAAILPSAREFLGLFRHDILQRVVSMFDALMLLHILLKLVIERGECS